MDKKSKQLVADGICLATFPQIIKNDLESIMAAKEINEITAPAGKKANPVAPDRITQLEKDMLCFYAIAKVHRSVKEVQKLYRSVCRDVKAKLPEEYNSGVIHMFLSGLYDRLV